MDFTYFKNQVQLKATSILAYCLVWMEGKNSFCNSPHPSWDGSSPLSSIALEHPVKLDLLGWILPTQEQFVSTAQTFVFLRGLILYLDLQKRKKERKNCPWHIVMVTVGIIKNKGNERIRIPQKIQLNNRHVFHLGKASVQFLEFREGTLWHITK